MHFGDLAASRIVEFQGQGPNSMTSITLSSELAARARAADTLWLVTGAAGFIGSNIVQTLLDLGCRVRGIDNFSTGSRANLDEIAQMVGRAKWANMDFVEADIRDRVACERAVADAGIVLHQAALGSVPRSIDEPITTNDVNVGGFVNMLDMARRANARFVYAASSSTYGDEPNLPKIEDRIGRPLSPYAVTKAVNEIYAEVFSRTYQYHAIGLRYFNVFGARQSPYGPYSAVIPAWVQAMLSGVPIKINGDGETSRDFTYVGNVVQANLLAALTEKPAKAEVFNVATEARTSLNQLVELIRDALRDVGVTYSLAPQHGAERAGDVRHSLASVAKARDWLGYAPTHDLQAGLAAAMPWYAETLSKRNDNEKQ
ncbi:MAG: SDR family oxidoreductase [Sphingomonas bacterium]|nr:SDR family oxidoreductase [Sphingomonas bacterium]